MKLWKKLMACTLAAVLALGVLTGCGQKVVMTEAFIDMVNRNLAQYYYITEDGVNVTGSSLKLVEGGAYSQEAVALRDKLVAEYQSWLKNDPILYDNEPDIDDIVEEMNLGEDYIACAYASKGSKDLVAIQEDLNELAHDFSHEICDELDDTNKTATTITVAEKQVDGWYYLVAVTKPVNK